MDQSSTPLKPPVATNEGVRCIACASEIPAAASKCSNCNSFQRRWRNELSYFSGLAAGITLIAAASTFVVTSWSEVRKFFVWQESVAIVRATAGGGTREALLTFSNTGDGDLLPLQLTYFYEPNRVIPLALPLQLDGLSTAGKSYRKEHPGTEVNLDGYQFATRKTSAECEQLMNSLMKSARSCFQLQWFTANHPVLQSFERSRDLTGRMLCTRSTEAVMVAFSIKLGKQLEFPFTTKTAVLVREKDSNCAGLNTGA